MTDLIELAERCEQATGPDRELDMLIDCALKGIVPVYPIEGHPMTPGRGGRIEAKGTFELLGWIDPGEVNRNFSPYGGDKRYPAVTASLDAAMTLVPDGWWVQHVGHCLNGWRARVERNAVAARASHAARKDALGAFLSALKVRQVGSGQQFAIRERQGIRDAAVYADRRQVVCGRLMLDLAGKACVPAKIIPRERHEQRAAAQRPGEAHSDKPKLGQPDQRPFCPNVLDLNLASGVGKGRLGLLQLEPGETASVAEKAIERLVQGFQRALQWRDRDSAQPIIFGPQLRQISALVDVVQQNAGLLRLPPKVAALLKPKIVDEANCVGRLLHRGSLIRRRVKPIAIGSLNHYLFLARERQNA